jgi:hypothetical protein
MRIIKDAIDQTKYNFIGYQAYYKDGSSEFFLYKDYHKIELSDLVDLKQVGEAWGKNK